MLTDNPYHWLAVAQNLHNSVLDIERALQAKTSLSTDSKNIVDLIKKFCEIYDSENQFTLEID